MAFSRLFVPRALGAIAVAVLFCAPAAPARGKRALMRLTADTGARVVTPM